MLEQLGTIHPLLPPAIGMLALFAGAVILDLIVKQVLIRAVREFAKRSSITWDDALVRHNVFGRLALCLHAAFSFGVVLVSKLLGMAQFVTPWFRLCFRTLQPVFGCGIMRRSGLWQTSHKTQL